MWYDVDMDRIRDNKGKYTSYPNITPEQLRENILESGRKSGRKIQLFRIKNGLCRDCGILLIDTIYKRCGKCITRNRISCKKYKEKYPGRAKQLNRKAFLQALDAYGGRKCACCGETTIIFLTLDHINNDGAEQRKKNKGAGRNLASYLRKRGYPTGIQVLCYNCNCGRYRNGGTCPHKER